jgi:hypothetical protein
VFVVGRYFETNLFNAVSAQLTTDASQHVAANTSTLLRWIHRKAVHACGGSISGHPQRSHGRTIGLDHQRLLPIARHTIGYIIGGVSKRTGDQLSDDANVVWRSDTNGDVGAGYPIGWWSREDERMFRVVEPAAAMRGKVSARIALPRHHEQRIGVATLPTQCQRSVGERAGDPTTSRRWVDHPGNLDVATVEAIQPEKSDKLWAVPPQQIVHLIRRSQSERSPFELESTTINRHTATLKFTDRVALHGRKPLGLFKHAGQRTAGATPSRAATSAHQCTPRAAVTVCSQRTPLNTAGEGRCAERSNSTSTELPGQRPILLTSLIDDGAADNGIHDCNIGIHEEVAAIYTRLLIEDYLLDGVDHPALTLGSHLQIERLS